MPILAWTGFTLLIVGGIGLLVAAFRAGILWGIGCLLIPPLQLVFLIVYWSEAKKPFFLQLVGLVIIIIAVVIYGDTHIDRARP